MHTATKIALAGAIIASMSCAAMARYTGSIPGDKVLTGAATGSQAPISTDISAQRERVRHSGNSRPYTYAPMQSSQVSGGVAADNYRYWRQACCQ